MKIEDSILSGVKTVVQEIVERDGKIAPTELVEAARPKESPAHPAFEWDNKKAGEQWRVHQARNLIRVVRVTVEEREERLVHVPRVIVQGADTREGYYRPISVVVEKPDEYQRALDAAVAKLNGAQAALDELHNIANQGGKADAAAAIAQMSKATQLFRESLASLH